MRSPIPKIIYGTAWKENRTAGLVEKALTAGFRAVDTANQAKHYNEVGVGEGLKKAFASGMTRESLFLQTKFTSRNGQDHRLPYDEKAPLKTQVAQSFGSSLQHLGTDYLDSYVLHGPYNFPRLGKEDWEVWGAMEEIFQSGAAKQLGISNVNALQLAELLEKAKVKPSVVQNRCYANRGWDQDVREICLEHGLMYQGFSLLTANAYALEDSRLIQIADRLQATPEQTVFRFSLQIGMTPLTGTTDEIHMKEDLLGVDLPKLTDDEMKTVENISL